MFPVRYLHKSIKVHYFKKLYLQKNLEQGFLVIYNIFKLEQGFLVIYNTFKFVKIISKEKGNSLRECKRSQ